MTMSKRTILVFILSLFLASWSIQAAAIAVVGDLESGAAAPWLIVTMFMPGLWALGYLALFNRAAFRRIRFWPGNPFWLVLAGLLPAALALVTLGLVRMLGWGEGTFFAFDGSGVDVLRGPWQLGPGEQDWLYFSANVALTALLFAAMNGVVAVGEEFGWRGVLQDHVIDRFGLHAGIVLLGLVWAFWHLPSILAGYNYPETPVLGGLVLFPVALVANSYVLAWLTLRARSFWPAVLFHGSVNGIFAGVTEDIAPAAGVVQLQIDLLILALQIVLGLAAALTLPRRTGQAAAVAADRSVSPR